MRRVLTALAVLAVAAIGLTAITGRSAQAGSTYRVDVVFDDAHGLIPGQLIQIAGAKVGTIDDVSVTPDFKARIKLKVQSKFAPFRQNAQCTIRPQGLIAENYVNCDPGSADAPALEGKDGQAPTVPLDHTTAPVPVTDLFDIWNAPVRDRLALIVNELGIGTAGRGDDFNAILRRANPSLKLARKVIDVLESQRADLATVLDHSDEIAGKVARNKGDVEDFLDEAAKVVEQTGSRSDKLSAAVAKLPPLLAATEPSLRDLDTVVDTATPLVKQIRRATPDINRLTADIHPFAEQSKPTLKALSPVLAQGVKTLKTAIPVSRLVKDYAHNSLPAAQLGGALFTDLRNKGFIENLLGIFYRGAAGTARFDSIGHILPAFITLGTCAVPATSPVAGCSANFTNTAVAQPKRAEKQKTPAVDAPPATQHPATQTPATPGTPQVTTPSPQTLTDTVKDAVDKLLGALKPPPKDGNDASGKNSVGDLLGFLLG